MCLGLPARVVGVVEDCADLVTVDMAGVNRMINVGLLDGSGPLAVGEWVLVHMGFALNRMTDAEAQDALAALDTYAEERVADGADRDAELREVTEWPEEFQWSR